jgi:uncharacterized protein
MKRFVLISALCLACPLLGIAQQSAADAPASKEDIDRYFQVMHLQDTMKQVMDIMTKQTHQMVHAQIVKSAVNLPPDFEARMNKMTDDELKNFPVEEMLQAMIPVYQKHWTKRDVDAMVTFYSTPTGQKVLRELPATMAEGMQAMQPIIEKKMNGMMERVQQEVAQMVKDSKSKAGQNSQATPN